MRFRQAAQPTDLTMPAFRRLEYCLLPMSSPTDAPGACNGGEN